MGASNFRSKESFLKKSRKKSRGCTVTDDVRTTSHHWHILKTTKGKRPWFNFRLLPFFFTDVVPSEQIIDIGRQARLECLTEDRDRSAVTWMKDGQPLPNHPRLIANRWVSFTKWAFLHFVEVFADLSFKNRLHSFFRQTLQIFNLQREDYGMYQCFVARGNQEAQASSELRLGGMCSSQIFAITLSSKTAQEKSRAKSIKLEAAAFLNKKGIVLNGPTADSFWSLVFKAKRKVAGF